MCISVVIVLAIPLGMSQPERVVRMVSDSLRVTSSDRRSQGNGRFMEAKKVDIVNFVTNTTLKNFELVSIGPFVCLSVYLYYVDQLS